MLLVGHGETVHHLRSLDRDSLKRVMAAAVHHVGVPCADLHIVGAPINCIRMCQHVDNNQEYARYLLHASPELQPNLLPRWQPSLQPSLQLESPSL